MGQMTPVGGLLTRTVADIGAAHLQSVVNEAGPISEAEVQAMLPHAARIHAMQWDRSPHPADAGVPSQAHDWATYHIAVNLVARERGYDPSAPWRRTVPVPAVRAPLTLSPAMRAGED
jgi:hypothetical protein